MILEARQKRAEELKRLTDQSASMSEEQLTELRADIKVPRLLGVRAPLFIGASNIQFILGNKNRKPNDLHIETLD